MKHSFFQSKYFILILLALSLAAYGFSSLPQGNNQEGWYLVSEEAIMSELDYSISGKLEKYMADYPNYEDRFYEINEGSISSGSFSFSTRRENPDGSILVSSLDGVTPIEGELTASWSRPPNFIAEGEQVSLQVTRSFSEDAWGIPNMSIGFFESHVAPGFATREAPYFYTPGSDHFPQESSSFTVEMHIGAPRGQVDGTNYAILVSFSGGYGYRYVYEWRDGSPEEVVPEIEVTEPPIQEEPIAPVEVVETSDDGAFLGLPNWVPLVLGGLFCLTLIVVVVVVVVFVILKKRK